MTSRERFCRILRHEKVDRMPYMFGDPRGSTFAALVLVRRILA